MVQDDRTTPRYLSIRQAADGQKMTRDEVRERFDREIASVYSQRAPVWLIEFETMFGLVPRLLQPILPEEGVVLDLGAGTGNLSRAVLEVFPHIRVVMMDYSPNMLNHVPNVLNAFTGQFETITADFLEADLGVECYDAVISSFALHHCRGEREYAVMYRKIHAALKPGGMFVCCDVVAGASEHLSTLNEQGWQQYLHSVNLTPEEVERMLHNYHIEDSPIDVGSHLRLLHLEGFGISDVVWKKHNFAVYVGIK